MKEWLCTIAGIVGGFIAEADGKVYDLSISSQLKEMKREIDG